MYKYVYICYRARQSEIKKEQEKVQLELDPGNPNWQFLKMIRYLILSYLLLESRERITRGL